MKKSLLSSFIDRYSLGGNTTSVKVISDNGGINCDFVTDNQNVLGSVKLDGLKLDSAELGIFQTPQLVKMLSALDNEIDVTLNKELDRLVSMTIKDSNTAATFMLADTSIIAPPPKLKYVPEMDVKIKVDKDFIDRFVKAKNALPDTENFAVVVKDGTVEIVVNYSEHNTSRISFDVDTVSTPNPSLSGPVCFSSTLFKEILVANKNVSDGIFEVSHEGLAKLTMQENDFQCVYYLVKLESV